MGECENGKIYDTKILNRTLQDGDVVYSGQVYSDNYKIFVWKKANGTYIPVTKAYEV